MLIFSNNYYVIFRDIESKINRNTHKKTTIFHVNHRKHRQIKHLQNYIFRTYIKLKKGILNHTKKSKY